MRELFRKQRAASVLGLALDGSKLEGVVLRRANGSLQAQKSFSVSLALNPLTGDPKLVGREIRNHFEQAGVRERRCVVCIPLSWALVVQSKIPDLPEADVDSFLQIESERGFPYGLEDLLVSTSRYRVSEKEQHATLVGIPKNHLLQLEAALEAAQLRPASFTFGVSALQRADRPSSQGVLALAIGENSVDLQLTHGGGVAMLRALLREDETEGWQQRFSADLIAREVRISMGQMPAEIRAAVRQAHVFGRGEMAQRLVREITPRLDSMGIRVLPADVYSNDEFGVRPPAKTPISAAFSVAASYLTGENPLFEFLPPKINAVQKFTAKFSSKKLAWAAATAGCAVLLVGSVFLWQQWQLSRLQSRWADISSKVRELDAMQQQIRTYRPWFDESFHNLNVLRKLTEKFPEDGAVSAKTVEIRDTSTVICSGTARDNRAFLKMLDQVRAIKEVSNLKVEQIRGGSPMQFTLNFVWNEGGGHEN
jgi:Tfp pilus assembly PilM family ATPase